MPTPAIGNFTERVQFFDGQRLFASDLQDLERFNLEMRRLHNQSLHQPGVASGYAVSGNKDDRQVTIQPGYAIDSQGREIVLTEPLTLQVPPVASDNAGRPVYYDLVVSYPADAELTENRAGVCVSRGAVRLREAPLFCWVELTPTDEPPGTTALAEARAAKLDSLKKDIEQGLRLRLARAEVLNCKLNQPLSIAQRRNARPVQQPYTYAGRTSTPGAWKVASSDPNVGIVLSLQINTQPAQFRSVPRYFAHVVGEREVSWLNDAGVTETRILDGFGRARNVLAASFEFSFLIPKMFFANDEELKDIAERIGAEKSELLNHWYVEWLGVEG